jgi:hypothetical protein
MLAKCEKVCVASPLLMRLKSKDTNPPPKKTVLDEFRITSAQNMLISNKYLASHSICAEVNFKTPHNLSEY